MGESSKLKRLFENQYFIFTIYFLITLIVTIRAFLLGANEIDNHKFTFYNNYVIFKNAFIHLINHQDLYDWYLSEQWDLYKYSPAFAVFMGLFAFFPDLLGLFLWNLLNNFVLLIGLKSLKLESKFAFALSALFILQDLINATMNSQSNALITGLLILGFSFWSKNQSFKAVLMISLAVFIKPFALVFFLFWFMFDKKINSLVYAILVFLVLAFSPMVVTSFDGFVAIYKSWFVLLTQDHDQSYGLSFMGFLNKTFHLEQHKIPMVVGSAILLFLPLIRTKKYASIQFQQYYAAFLLIWMIIFNHKAESPTFIVAVAGVAIWYFTTKKNNFETVLLFFVLFFTEFSTSDIFPAFIRNNFFKPYEIKVVPCILVWFWVGFRLLTEGFTKNDKAIA